jgi:hypothetical protein
MNTGQRLGLVLLYGAMAGNAVLMLGLFIQILFRAAIERHHRRQFAKRNAGAAPRGFDGKRGWANKWLPRNPETIQPAPDRNSAGKLAGAGPIFKQAIALVSIVIPLGLAATVAAQPRTGRDVTASTLKQQLLELESKETWLRMRLEELNEQLKPESIERELAGIGSTRPEELREHRRRLLTIERNGLQKQLDLLGEERARIEAAIVAAEAAANVDYTQPSPSPLQVTVPAKPITEMVSLKDLGIAELPLQKLCVAIAMFILLVSGFTLLLIAAATKAEQWIVSTRKEAKGFQTHLYCFEDPLTPTEETALKNTQGVQS